MTHHPARWWQGSAILLATLFLVSHGYAWETDSRDGEDATPAINPSDTLPKYTLSEMLTKDEGSLFANVYLSIVAKAHTKALQRRNETGVKRLAFFFDFLDHADVDVAANAHLEFALASADDFAAFCQQLMPNQVRDLIGSKGNPEYRVRLYLAMLAQCGDETDGNWLGQRLAAKEAPRPLPEWIAAYLALKGDAGFELVNRKYLANPPVESSQFANMYAALMALRSLRDHPNISKESRVKSVRLVLKHGKMEDLAIASLSFHQDWSAVEDVVRVFKSPALEWSRTPAVNYLRACPSEEAREALKEVTEIDPAAVQRAKQFFPDKFIAKQRQQGAPPIRPVGRGETDSF